MKKFYYTCLKYCLTVLLLLTTLVLSAQEKQMISLINSQSVVDEQSSLQRNFTKLANPAQLLPVMDLNQFVPVSNSIQTLQSISPSFEAMPKTLRPELKSAEEANTVLTFPCDGSPVGMEDSYIVQAGKNLVVAAPGLLTNDIDPEDQTIIVSNYFPPSHGTLLSIVTNGSFSYEPENGFTGTDSFGYLLLDTDGNYSEQVTVTIEVVDPFNRKPVGLSDDYVAYDGTPLTIAAPGLLSNDFDPDGDAIIVSNYFPPTHGNLTSIVTNGAFTYVPEPGYTGTDNFQYLVLDANGTYSDPVTVTIEILDATNRKPEGNPDYFGIVEGGSLVVTAPGLLYNDVDPDGDAIIVSNYFPPSHGTLTSIVTNGSFTYVPAPGFTGTDNFQYIARDANGAFSEQVNVTIDVIAAGELPYGAEDYFAVEKDQTLTISAPGLLFNDFDPNGDNIIVSNYIPPANGTLTSIVTNGSFIYEPPAGFTGTDSFQYTLLDEDNNYSAPVTVTIEVVESYNRIPEGGEDYYSTEAETPLVIAAPGLLANDSDPDGDNIIVSNYFPPANGTLTSIVTNGSFTYVPNTGFTGDDSFQYLLYDENGNYSAQVTVNISVRESDNRKPIGVPENYALSEGTTLTIPAPGLLSNDVDPDGDVIIVSNYFAPSHGTLTSIVTNGSFIYVPDAGFSGTDSYQYILYDQNGSYSDPVTVMLHVFGENQDPVAGAADITAECEGPAGTTVMLDGSSSTDPEDGTLQYTWYEGATVIAGPSELPTAEVILSTGVHSITLVVEDECGNTSSDNATVTVEDTSAPLVEAAFLPTDKSNEFEISCTPGDLCSGIISSMSVIRIPELKNPSVSWNDNKNYSLVIDVKKKTVDVKAPDAAAFWAAIVANGGVEVNSGQVIKAKYDKSKFKFSFDSEGHLVSVEGNIVTLLCTATDTYGNVGEGEAVLPPEMLQQLTEDPTVALKSVAGDASGFNDVVSSRWHRNYPNPFTRQTTIEYQLDEPAYVLVSVFDAGGRRIQELSAKQMPAGIQQVTWHAGTRKPGIYYYRITYDGNQFSGRMLLLDK